MPPLMEENRQLGDLPDKRYLRRMRELYYAAISHVDYNLGRILNVLEEIGELDNTFIIFLSDHGELLGDYKAYQKWLPYDSCARIPFIIRYPEKFKQGSIETEFVDLNDVLPTILEIAGIDYPDGIELPGESLLTEGVKKKDRDYQYIEYARGSRRWISLRDKRYKYNYYYGGGFEELFDLVNDPHETCNLLEEGVTEEILDKKQELRKRLIQYEKKYGLEGYVRENDFIKLEPYNPKVNRENLFPVLHRHIMDEEEKNQMNDYIDEIIQAVEKEPVVNLEELDLKTWQQNNHFDDQLIKRMLKRYKENK
jgi:arylsulfatase